MARSGLELSVRCSHRRFVPTPLAPCNLTLFVQSSRKSSISFVQIHSYIKSLHRQSSPVQSDLFAHRNSHLAFIYGRSSFTQSHWLVHNNSFTSSISSTSFLSHTPIHSRRLVHRK